MARLDLTQRELRALAEAVGFRLAGDTEDIERDVPHLESAHAKITAATRWLPRLRWTRKRYAATTEVYAPSAIAGRTYTVARYAGQRRGEQWRLTASDEDETLYWAATLRQAKETAQAYEDQRIKAAQR